MEKKVFCVIGARCKSIKFISGMGVSDATAIKNNLILASEKDLALKTELHGKTMILQRKTPERSNQLCDIDEEDEIQHKEDIHVVLLDLPKLIDCQSKEVLEAFGKEKTLTLDLPIIYHLETKTTTNDGMDIDSTSNTNSVIYQEQDELPNVELSDNLQTKNDNASSKQAPKMSKTSRRTSATISYPAELPKIPPHLQKKLDIDGIFESSKSFIHFWGIDIEQRCDGEPTKDDYHNYAQTIVDTYPALRGGRKGFNIVSGQLSASIRNRRANFKRKANDKNQNVEPKSATLTSASITQDVCQTETDINSALTELQKSSNSTDTEHVRRLLRETLPTRRMWIESHAKSIKEVTNSYPQLKNYDLMVFELELLKNKSVQVLVENIDMMILKLSPLFNINNSTEEEKCTILIKLWDQLNSKKLNKSLTPLFIIKKALSCTENLLTSEGESPRAVLYTAEGSIAASFVVADTLRIKIPEPTVNKTVMCLLAAYYAWDTSYPNAYKNTMQYIDCEVLGTALAKNSTVEKLIRRREYMHNKKAQNK